MVANPPRSHSVSTPLAAHAPAFLESGRKYLQAVDRDHHGRHRFGPMVAVNTVCLAVEHLLYGLCLSWGVLPEGSCLIGLANESVRATPLAPAAMDCCLRLSGLFDVCSLLPDTRLDDLCPADAAQALTWGRELAESIDCALPPSACRNPATERRSVHVPCRS